MIGGTARKFPADWNGDAIAAARSNQKVMAVGYLYRIHTFSQRDYLGVIKEFVKLGNVTAVSECIVEFPQHTIDLYYLTRLSASRGHYDLTVFLLNKILTWDVEQRVELCNLIAGLATCANNEKLALHCLNRLLKKDRAYGAIQINARQNGMPNFADKLSTIANQPYDYAPGTDYGTRVLAIPSDALISERGSTDGSLESVLTAPVNSPILPQYTSTQSASGNNPATANSMPLDEPVPANSMPLDDEPNHSVNSSPHL